MNASIYVCSIETMSHRQFYSTLSFPRFIFCHRWFSLSSLYAQTGSGVFPFCFDSFSLQFSLSSVSRYLFVWTAIFAENSVTETLIWPKFTLDTYGSGLFQSTQHTWLATLYIHHSFAPAITISHAVYYQTMIFWFKHTFCIAATFIRSAHIFQSLCYPLEKKTRRHS